ncbi:MAG: hypothetical protein JWR50_623 [Mucilaginibacter sp.]|nr:hypothetical protein [Mucilaginibacter sp.]
MHPVYRSLIAVAFAAISIMITCNKCQQQKARQQAQQEWGPELDTRMKNLFYQQASRLTTDEYEKNEYADCCLDKMKELFPNGPAGAALMTDSMQAAALKMGADCAKVFKKNQNIWTPDVDKQLRLQFYSLPEVKLLPKETREEYVNCLAFKIEDRFPTGFSTDSGKKEFKKFNEKARTSCLKLIVNKYQKAKKIKLDTIAK